MKSTKQRGEKIFILEALKKFGQIGSIFPSSKYLAKSIAECIPNKEDVVVVELGAGTGTITKEILKKISITSSLIACEKNKKMAEFLKNEIHDPRLLVIEGDAISMQKVITSLGHHKADCVVSGIPLGTLKKYEQDMLLLTIKELLKNDGVYVQFQYFLSTFLNIKRYFKSVKIKKYVLRNLPPAFVYKCQK